MSEECSLGILGHICFIVILLGFQLHSIPDLLRFCGVFLAHLVLGEFGKGCALGFPALKDDFGRMWLPVW